MIATYILHVRAYQDSSAILECFSESAGLVALIARGAKRPKSRMQGLIQPFICLEMAWVGKGEIKTLTQIEAANLSPRLTGNKIALGLYLNELLMRLLIRFDPYPQLFNYYQDALNALAATEDNLEWQRILRIFEKHLLAELGYGLDLSMNAQTGESILPELLYCYDPLIGLCEVTSLVPPHIVVVSGASIIALHHNALHTKVECIEAKKLMRSILAHHLGNKPLHSRKLFI